MPRALPFISQGGIPGTNGISRNDLDLYSVASESIVFQNSIDESRGVQSWEWTLIERPPGSTAELLAPFSSVAELQADVYGRYVVSLRINGLGNETSGYYEIVASCPFPSILTLPSADKLGNWDLPAAREGFKANWSSNTKGAHPEVYRMLKQVREHLLSADFQEPQRIPFMLSYSLPHMCDSGGFYITSAYLYPIDLTDFPWANTVKFYATIRRYPGGGTAYARIYDHTNGVAVTNGDVSTTNTFYTYLETAALTVGGAAGNMRNDAPTIYRLEIDLVVGFPGVDFCWLANAGLVLSPE